MQNVEEILETVRAVRLNLLGGLPKVTDAANRLMPVIAWLEFLVHNTEQSSLSESELELLDTIVNQIRSVEEQKFVIAIETESGGRLYFASADAKTLAGWVYRTIGGPLDG